MPKAPQLSSFKQSSVRRFSSYHYSTQDTITIRVWSPPAKSAILHTMGAILLCLRKFICAVSCTGRWPSQLFSINITVALAVPLKSDSHYTRHCTNSWWGRIVSYQQSPSRRSCKAGDATFFITFFFKPQNLKETNSPVNLTRNTSRDPLPVPTSLFNIPLMRFNRSYNGFQIVHALLPRLNESSWILLWMTSKLKIHCNITTMEESSLLVSYAQYC